MRRWMTVTALLLALPALAQAGGMMGNGVAGPGSVTVADDGSVLVLQGTYDGEATGRVLRCIGTDGSQRWQADLADGVPTAPVTKSGVVVVGLGDGAMLGDGSDGDSGWNGGGNGTPGQGDGQLTLVALDLATGAEMWRTDLDGGMGGSILFAPDASRLYVVAGDPADGSGGGPMSQGDAAGSGTAMNGTLYALDPANGAVLWTVDVQGGAGGSGGGGGMGGGRWMGVAANR